MSPACRTLGVNGLFFHLPPSVFRLMAYQALYRKYRPQSFEDIVGQGHVTSTLAREVSEGRVAHAYLFAGPRGTGKTTTARILAKALNCENRAPNGSPDNLCESCVAITEGSSLDVMELDAASHNSVEDIRDMRLSVTTVASSANSRRVYILDEAHMLSKAAGNALLKTLEEPPEHVIFVLATTEPYKLLDTIRSRTQRFDFHPVGVEALAAHLARLADAEGYKADAQALVAVARHSGGSARDALSLLEQVAALGSGTVDVAGVHRTLGMADSEVYTRLADSIASGDARSALELVAEMASRGIDLRRFIGEAIGFFRGVFLAHYSPNLAEVVDEPAEILDGWKKASARIGPGDVLRAVDLLGEALVKLREGREERLMVELAMIKLTRPETATDSDALLARLERLERTQAPDQKRTQGAGRQTPALVPPLEGGPLVRSESEGGARATPAGEPFEPTAHVPTPASQASNPQPTGPTALVSTPEPHASNSVPVSADRLNEIWPALFGGLRQVLGARRWALFREATPAGIEGNSLILHVAQDFHLEGLQRDAATTALVATHASDLLGQPVGVEFRKAGAASPPGEDALSRIELDKDRLFEAPADAGDPTALLERELGATFVEEIVAERD
ncbi:MAG: DNA polymerase III subunit gamma/tau [Acidimicrobiia bacterium]